MLLSRQDNFLQRKDEIDKEGPEIFAGGSKSCKHEKDFNNMVIYQCCFEICCQKCLKSNQTKEGHICTLNKENKVKDTVAPVKLTTIFTNMLKKQDRNSYNVINRNLDFIQCSVCQKSNISNKKLKFYGCQNCKGQYCEKCQLIVHGKGKFMSHQVKQIQKIRQNFSKQNILICEIHKKIRRCLLKDEIVCESCFLETTKRPFAESQRLDLSTISQNVRFSTEFYNEMYHNEGNKISEAKQNLKKMYQEMIERIQERYLWNMSHLQKTQSNLKKVFTKNLNQIEKIDQEIQLITLNEDKFVAVMKKDIINIRMQLINEKLTQMQSECEDFIGEINFEYKVGDKEKYEHLIQQFLKCLNVTKLKRSEDDSIHTNRSIMRNHLKTSRATSRPSSNRLTNSKEYRYNSSFKKNDFSSNKQNSSYKEKSTFMKNDSRMRFQNNQTSVKKNINRSVSIKVSDKDKPQVAKYNINLKEKELNLKDVKELQKAEYQDLNLNLRKLITSRKPIEVVNNPSHIEKVQEKPQENTSLQKISLQVDNANKKPLLIKQNQKCQITSGIFLKLFQSRRQVSSRKNYLLSSAQELSQNDSIGKQYKSRIQILSSNRKMISPQKSSQLKTRNIKQQLFKSGQSSNKNNSEVQIYTKFADSSSPVQKSSKTRNEPFSGQTQLSYQNPSLIFEKLIAVSNEKQSQQLTSQFNPKCTQETSIQPASSKPLQKAEISSFSTVLTHQSELKNTSESIRSVSMVSSVQICEFNAKQNPQINKGKIKVPSTSKVLQNKEINHNKPIPMKITVEEEKSVPNCSQNINPSNNLRGSQKVIQEKVTANERAKKKPDFMDMRQRMRKPNYLSSRFGSSIPQAVTSIKVSQVKK